jgi:hypothetical protein
MSSQCPLQTEASSSQVAEIVKMTGFDIGLSWRTTLRNIPSIFSASACRSPHPDARSARVDPPHHSRTLVGGCNQAIDCPTGKSIYANPNTLTFVQSLREKYFTSDYPKTVVISHPSHLD